jgi:FAD/FMN-containing dehydrogenase
MSSVPAEAPADRSAQFNELRALVPGAVVEAHQPKYEELARPWNLAVEMRPAAVVAARSATEVAATVAFARAHKMTVGVQATGHGAVSCLAGDILVVTRYLDELTVHPGEGWARAGAYGRHLGS